MIDYVHTLTFAFSPSSLSLPYPNIPFLDTHTPSYYSKFDLGLFPLHDGRRGEVVFPSFLHNSFIFSRLFRSLRVAYILRTHGMYVDGFLLCALNHNGETRRETDSGENELEQ
jgi:hypothetical protein